MDPGDSWFLRGFSNQKAVSRPRPAIFRETHWAARSPAVTVGLPNLLLPIFRQRKEEKKKKRAHQIKDKGKVHSRGCLAPQYKEVTMYLRKIQEVTHKTKLSLVARVTRGSNKQAFSSEGT